VRDVNHSHLEQRLRNCGAIPLLPLYGFMAWRGTTLLFPVLSLSWYPLAFFWVNRRFFPLMYFFPYISSEGGDYEDCLLGYEHRQCIPSSGYTSRTLTKKYRYIYTRLHGVTSHPLLP